MANQEFHYFLKVSTWAGRNELVDNKIRHRPGKEMEAIMRKSMVVFIALVVLAAGGAAWADTNTLTVQASVLGTCRFSSSTSTLSFGALDPSVGTDVSGSTTTNYWCTKGVTALITPGFGEHRVGTTRQMIDIGSGDLIPYSLTFAGSGTPAGPGSPLTLTITGNVLGTDYISKSAGGYSDTVLITLAP
jgi:spore coat protein U-like protein